MGPKCPKCGTTQEFCVTEIYEEVYSPRIFFCINLECRNMFMIDSDNMRNLQEFFRMGLEQEFAKISETYNLEEDIATMNVEKEWTGW